MQDAQTVSPEQVQTDANRHVPLPLRNDTMLGVCEGLGEDLGINPNLLRILFGALIFFNVSVAIGSYLAMGVVVAASRYFFPKPAATMAAPEAQLEAANAEAELQIAA